jgi:phospholipid/cholesterol/gamma-HCH transport system substrate-binding protein
VSRAPIREIRAGLAVVAALAALFVLMALAHGGPGFLTSRRNVDVVFRDGQGIRAGSPVRVAGIDAGRVTAVDLTEVDGQLRARVRMALPADLAGRLKVDAKVTIQSSLTGQGCVNILSAGRSAVALVPGQVLQGVESSMFDPILEQVGLGPVERSHLSHTIAQVRETVDAAGPRLRLILASLQDASNGLRETTEKVRPAVESTADHVQGLARRLEEAKIEETIQRVHALAAQAEALLAENRPNVQAALVGVRDVSTGLKDMLAKDRPKIDAMLDGFNGTRVRLDQVLDQTRIITTQGADFLTASRPELERIVANGKDASDYGVKLVQKLYGNPFYLSPLYKPRPEDVRAQEFYDVSLTFMHGAKELDDAVKRLQAMKSQPMTEREQKAFGQLFQRAWTLNEQLRQVSAQLAEGVRGPSRR